MTKKYLVIATFLLLILALSYGISRRFKPAPTQTIPPTTSEQNQQTSPSGKKPEPQIAVPDGWRTYENKGFGFRISYPASWFEQEIAQDRNGNVAAKSFTTAKKIGPLLGGMGDQDLIVSVHVTLDFPYETLEEAKINHSGLIYWQDYDPRAEYVKQVYFKNLPAVERMGLNPAETRDYYILTIEFVEENRLYLIKLLCLTREALTNHERTFRKVLETFDFIE